MKTDALTHARLVELLSYDPMTGAFAWRPFKRKGYSTTGRPAGSRHQLGYIHIQIDGVIYKAHRLAWLYVHGVWPSDQIDHRDGVKDNNRIGNLRDADAVINGQNRRVAHRNTSTGLIGAHKHGNAFTSQIRSQGVIKHLGRFPTATEAHQAYVAAKRELHEGCTL